MKRHNIYINLRLNNFYKYGAATITFYFSQFIIENWDRSKLTDLQSEMKILIHVGENENIVNILGACTKG